MYNVVMYEDARGYSPVEALIKQLDNDGSKDAIIQLNIIMRYIDRLEVSGTRAGEDITKHVRGDIWELRPGKIRIFYARKGNTFVLLTWFQKKSNKTPQREIDRAEQALKDWGENFGQEGDE